MANVRTANSYHVDTASTGGPPSTTNALISQNIKLVGIMVTNSAANSVITLSDNSSTQPTVITLENDDANRSRFWSFHDTPILFPNGIAITTITNCTATLLVREANS